MERTRKILTLKTFKFRPIIILLGIFFLNGCATVPSRSIGLKGIYHIVEPGQTLYSIAKTYNIDVDTLMRINRINNPAELKAGQKLFIPGVTFPLKVEPPFLSLEYIEKLVGPKRFLVNWRYITIHHSATHEGNAFVFDRYHRLRRMGGLFYHFVIGNGHGSKDGEIEVGWRWREQVEVNRPADIQICLVGNFNLEFPTEAQISSLVKLIKVLMKQYNIPLSHVRRHRDVSFRTECPGRYFPFYRVLQELKEK